MGESKKADQIKRESGKIVGQSVASFSKGESPPGVPSPPRRERPAREQGVSRNAKTFDIEVDQLIADPDQPRTEFDGDAIDRMAASLLKRGQITPIAARWSNSDSKWVIVAGERRWRGAMKAGLKTLTVVERAGTDSADILADQLIENLIREDLSPIEQGRAFRRLMELHNWTGMKLAEELNVPQPTVSQALALLDLPESILEKVALEEISGSTAYEISKVADPVAQEQIAAEAVAEGLTRDQTRERVKRAKAEKTPKAGRGGKGSGKGRGAKPKPKTTWIAKAQAGHRITVEYRKGIDPATIPKLLREVAELAEANLAVVG